MSKSRLEIRVLCIGSVPRPRGDEPEMEICITGEAEAAIDADGKPA